MKASPTRGCCISSIFHERRNHEEAPRPLGAVSAAPRSLGGSDPDAPRARLGLGLGLGLTTSTGGGAGLPPSNRSVDSPPARAHAPAAQAAHIFISFHQTLHEKLMSVSLADGAGRCCYGRHVLCTKTALFAAESGGAAYGDAGHLISLI